MSNNSFEVKGELLKKGETQQVTPTFKKRELVLKIDDGKYPQTVPFELLQDRCSALDPFNEGDVVKVSFNLRGREWSTKYFVNLAAWRIEAAEQQETEQPEQEAKQKAVTTESKEGSDLPF